jgi:hypothetical protein
LSFILGGEYRYEGKLTYNLDVSHHPSFVKITAFQKLALLQTTGKIMKPVLLGRLD